MAKSTHSADTQHPHQAVADTTTARLELPAAEFALSDLFERVPSAHIKCEPVVANSGDRALVVIRTDMRDHDTVETALRRDSSVGMIECLNECMEGWVYQLTWANRAHEIVQRVLAEDVTLLSAQAREGQWHVRLVAPTRSAFATAYEAIEDLGCTPECQSISTFDDRRMNRPNLTDKQREALVEAFEADYYNLPQDAIMDVVADEFGITYQALSERLHRAYSRLVERTLCQREK
ncbi:MAG TPA: helix-turn-helix domain-containing protein [Halococcus sp.]|nr:helix-turn-helix domain-containing protein [Halococcus sp.]